MGWITRFFGEQKEGSVVTENPKGGIIETLEEFKGATTQIRLENEDMGGGGGPAKVRKCYLAGSLQ